MGSAQAHAADFDIQRAFEISGDVADVGGRTAHVEGDDAIEAAALRGARRTDDAAGRA
jgi:hypothetical protein